MNMLYKKGHIVDAVIKPSFYQIALRLSIVHLDINTSNFKKSTHSVVHFHPINKR